MARSSLFQNRWWVVFGSFLGLIVSQAAISFAFGVLLKPVSEDLDVSRRTLSFAFNLFTITSAVFIPIVGFLIDRYRVRTVIMPLIVLFALTTAGLSYLQPNPVVLYGLFMLQGVFAACQVPSDRQPLTRRHHVPDQLIAVSADVAKRNGFWRGLETPRNVDQIDPVIVETSSPSWARASRKRRNRKRLTSTWLYGVRAR